MKKIIYLCFALVAFTKMCAQNLEINTFVTIGGLNTKIENINSDDSKNLNKSSIKFGKGIAAQMPIYKNGYIGIAYAKEKASFHLEDYQFKRDNVNINVRRFDFMYFTNTYSFNFSHRINFVNDSVHQIKFSLMPILQADLTFVESYRYEVFNTVSRSIPNTNAYNTDSYIDASNGRINPLDAKTQMLAGIGANLTVQHFNLIAGVKFSTNYLNFYNPFGYDQASGYLSGINFRTANNYFYLGIGYSLAPFSKKTIFKN
jgi:hypothetical protein